MKRFPLILTIVALALGMTQCRKPVIEPTTPIVNNGEKQHITFGTGDSGAKVNVVGLATGDLTWEANDVIFVYNQDAEGTVGEYLGFISLKTGQATANGTFEGDVRVPETEHGYRAFYYFAKELAGTPSQDAAPTVAADFSNQTENGWAGYDKIKQNLIMRYKGEVSPSGSYNGDLTPCFGVTSITVGSFAGNVTVTGLEGNVVAVNEYGLLSTTTATSKGVPSKDNPAAIQYKNTNANIVLVVPPVASNTDTKLTLTYTTDNETAKTLDFLLPRQTAVQGSIVGKDQIKVNVNMGEGEPEYKTVSDAISGGNDALSIDQTTGAIVINKPEAVAPIPEPQPYVATIAGKGDYMTLTAAFAASADGDEIVMLSDYTADEVMEVKKNVTLNIGDYHLRFEGDLVDDMQEVFQVLGDGVKHNILTIKGDEGTISSSYGLVTIYSSYCGVVVNGGTLSTEAGSLIGTYDFGVIVTDEHPEGLLGGLTQGKTVTINGGTLIMGDDGNGLIHIGANSYDNNVDKNTLTINGGEFLMNASSYCTFYLSNNCVANISNCTIVGNNINRGISLREDAEVTLTNVSMSCVERFFEVDDEGKLTVNSGVYNVTNPWIPFYEDDNGKILLKGGTYNVDPSDYVAAGYEAVEGEGVWTVQEKQGSASGYATTNSTSTYFDFSVGEQFFAYSLTKGSHSYDDCLLDKTKGITVTITEATSENYNLSAVVNSTTLYYLIEIDNMAGPDNEGDPNINLYVKNASDGKISGNEYTYAGYGYGTTISTYPGKSFYMIGAISKK